MKRAQKGFTVVEILLALLVAAAIGFGGYYVWHTQHKNSTTSNSTPAKSVSTSSSSSSPASTQKYLTITQWGVRALYDGTDSFSYTIVSNGSATIISKELAQTYGCTESGAGVISRLAPADDPNPAGDGTTTAQQSAAANPGVYGHVGNYYYAFYHNQSACSTSVTADAQNKANNVIKALVPKLEEIPAQ